MELKEIMAVSGKSGLFKVVAQTRNGMIVESLTENRRFPVYASDKVSNLAEISIYTLEKDVSLSDVFKKINELEKGGKAIDHKSDDNKLKAYFEKALPDYDKERVYVSDIRKVINWYNILTENGGIDFSAAAAEEETEAQEESISQEETPKEEVKKTSPKKSAKPKKEKDADSTEPSQE
jgi:hypothetical protein